MRFCKKTIKVNTYFNNVVGSKKILLDTVLEVTWPQQQTIES
jgi:hypothetical protein